MNSTFNEVSPMRLTGNPIEQIAHKWMLVSSADPDAGMHDVCGITYNTMTASWGGVGQIWNRPAAFVWIRPERHTYSFAERNLYLTLSFFGGDRREELSFCGKHSGRDTDKAAACSLTPVFTVEENGERAVYFQEASRVMVLKKMYAAPTTEEAFIDQSCLDFYKSDGFHKMYVCEIVRVLERS